MPDSPPHAALSYSKWDQLEVSDDEDGDVKPALASTKTREETESDERVVRRFTTYQEQFPDAVPRAQRALVAHLVGVTDKRGAPSNAFRYSEITAFCMRHKDELLTKELVSAVCRLHSAMIGDTGDTKPPPSSALVADCKMLVEAINTLEACREQVNISTFFEELCSPSSSARARQLCEKYQKLEFAKRAMLKHMFAKSGMGNESEIDSLMEEVDSGDKPKAASSKMDTDIMLACALVVLLLAIVVGGGFYLLQ